MSLKNISVMTFNLFGNNMYRTLPFLKIFKSKFNLEIISGYVKDYFKSATHLSTDIFKDINIKLFPIYFSYKKPYSLLKFLNIQRYIEGDLIICYKMLPDHFIPSVFKKITDNKFLIIDIDDYQLGFKKLIDKKIHYYVEKLKIFANLIISGSKTLQKLYGGVYIPTPVDTDFFNKKNFDSNLIRGKYGLGDSPIILYMGTFKSHKGIKEIFDIFSLVLKENKKVKLLMVGGSENQTKNENYIKYGKKRCGKSVIFTGFQPHSEIPNFISTADIFFTPVRDNPIIRAQTPAKVAEVQSMELPIVSSAVGEYENLINDDIDGFLLEPNDILGFKNKLIYLLENESEREKFGLKARNTCLKNSSFEVIEKRIFSIFKKFEIF